MAESENAPPVGFYETFRTSGGRPHHWAYHLRRLHHACAKAALALPASSLARDEARLEEAVRSSLQARDSADGVFRYTIETNAGEARENLAMRPLPAATPADGVALRVLAVRRTAAEWLPRPKRFADANVLLGNQEIGRRSAAASDEGLFLSEAGGLVVETTRQAVFWISGDTIRYPDPAVGGVAGTCFAWVLERGGRPEPARASLDELLKADAVAVCNAVRGVTPVREVWDGEDRVRLRTFSSAQHPRLKSLSAAWAEALRGTAEASR